MRSLGLFMLFLLCSVASVSAANPASTNYELAEGYFLSAEGNAQSAGYKIDEGRIDSFAAAAASSTNYRVDGRIGIRGTNSIPEITSISPVSPSKTYTDESASFTVTVNNFDGDSLQYQVKQDGVIKDGPQASSSLTWSLSGADQGAHTYLFEVIDPQGTVVQSQRGHSFRKPTK